MCLKNSKLEIGKNLMFIYFVEKVVIIFYEKLNIQNFYTNHQNKVFN